MIVLDADEEDIGLIARTVLFVGGVAMLAVLNSGTLLAQHPHSLAQRIASTDRTKMAHVERRHDGAAAGMDVMGIAMEKGRIDTTEVR